VRFDYQLGGAVAGGQQPITEFHAINSDTADASAAQGGGLAWVGVSGSLNAGAVGGRTAFSSNFTQNGATTAAGGQYYVGGARSAQASYSAGGTSGASAGSLFAANDIVILSSGATWWEEVVGYELDVTMQTGASCNYRHGMKLVTGGAGAGAQGKDYGYTLAASSVTTAGMDVGYAFGDPYGWWPVKPGGILFGTVAGQAGGPAYAAAWGIDFSAVAFSGGLIRGPGFNVSGTGAVNASAINAGAGLHCGSQLASGAGDFSKHLDLYGGQFGLTVTSSVLNVVSADTHLFYSGATNIARLNSGGLYLPTGGVAFPTATASGPSDFSKQINLYNGQAGISITGDTNLNYVGFGNHVFYAGATLVGQVNATAITSVGGHQVGGTSGPTWTTGSCVPSSTQPVGSLYSRVSTWAAGATLYVSKGAGAWTAVASV
jgi:hypothetical protein